MPLSRLQVLLRSPPNHQRAHGGYTPGMRQRLLAFSPSSDSDTVRGPAAQGPPRRAAEDIWKVAPYDIIPR
jgi:hypothetical protein